MSRAKNCLAKAYSGIFGQQVTLKGRGGKVVMTFPYARKKQVPSEKQIAYRRKFQVASRCAANLLKDPEIRKAYRARARKGQTAYNLALRDYLKATDPGQVEVMIRHSGPSGQVEKREILFPVKGDFDVHDRPALQAGFRGIQWPGLFSRMFKRYG